MSILLPEPYQLQFAPWGALVAEQLAVHSVRPPTDEVDWQTWARELANAPELVAKNVPLPDGYPDWRLWAHQLIECLL